MTATRLNASLDDKSEKRPFRATWMEMYVRDGTRWRVDLRRSNAVASSQNRLDLVRNTIAEFKEVMCWIGSFLLQGLHLLVSFVERARKATVDPEILFPDSQLVG